MKSKYILFLLGAVTITGCNYLDFDESTGKSKEYAYRYFDELARNVTHIYAQMQPDWGVIGGALREAASDNAIYTWNTSGVYKIYEDTWSSINPVDDSWSHYYSAIRAANVFLENFSLEELKKYENNASYADDIAKASMYSYEVRFLRSYFFFELSKRYGDIPLLLRSYALEEINLVTKNKYDDIIEFIADECDEIAPLLPESQRTFYNETGRITRGVVMAFKSRALLYAASELHNTDHNAAKWEKAAIASLDLIKKSEEKLWYSLIPGEKLFSNGNDMLTAKQLILERRGTPTNDFEARNLPIGFEGANSGNTPTQNLVDAFEMADGSLFDWSNAIHKANPYNNRDPRLYSTIVLNNSTLMRKTVQTFYGGANGQPIPGATLTGYYQRKYIDESVSLSSANPVTKNHHYVLFRYAEILLNYAEALNEWKGPDYTDATFTISARSALNRIRAYAAMPDVVAADQVEFRAKTRNERRVELAFEDHRFWDIRRWRIGSVVKDIYGVHITGSDAVFAYEKVKVQTRIWDDKMYLYPIAQTEIYMNKNLTQNPGW